MTARARKLVKISDIVAEKDYMMRESLDKDLVKQYSDDWDSICEVAPIIIYDTPDGLILADGFHRLAAARLLDNELILADVRKGLAKDAYAHACIANLKHGKPLSKNERNHAISEFIKTRVGWSDRRIADETGVSRNTIGRRRKSLEADSEIEPQKERKGKDEITQKVGVPLGTPEIHLFDEWFDEHVIQGDSLELMKTIDRKFDLMIIDPPYGITTETWDLENKHELLAFTRRWMTQALQLLKPSGRLFVFWSRKYMFDLKPLFDEIELYYPLKFGGVIVWHFRNVGSMPDNQKRYKLAWEPVFYYYGTDAPNLDRTPTEISGEKWTALWDVWTYAIPQSNFSDKREHPTQKPLELYKHIINSASNVGDSILDPFAGSGTTAHAGLLTGRNVLLIEKEDEYIKIIKNRLRPVWETKENDE